MSLLGRELVRGDEEGAGGLGADARSGAEQRECPLLPGPRHRHPGLKDAKCHEFKSLPKSLRDSEFYEFKLNLNFTEHPSMILKVI